MPKLHRSTASLRFFGDQLDPDRLSAALGAEPTLSCRKGDVRIGKVTGKEWIERAGKWLLHADDASPADLDAQVANILGALTEDLDVWRSLSSEYQPDLFCGFFMEGSDEGLSVSASSLKRLGDRGIRLGMCLYSGRDD